MRRALYADKCRKAKSISTYAAAIQLRRKEWMILSTSAVLCAMCHDTEI